MSHKSTLFTFCELFGQNNQFTFSVLCGENSMGKEKDSRSVQFLENSSSKR